MITAITPTGDRRLAFTLCQHWMNRQTVKIDQWIVVDDGSVYLPVLMPMEYIKRGEKQLQPRTSGKRSRWKAARSLQPKRPETGWASIYANLAAAVSLVRGDKILFIEDDEYYAPNYVEEMTRRLDEHELVGIKHSRYYHLPTGGYRLFTSQAHASLAQTAFRSSFLPTFKNFMEMNRCAEFLDVRLWTQSQSTRSATMMHLRTNCRGHLFFDETPLYVGMKGMPGRAGYGVGHKPRTYATHDSPRRDLLRQWIPQDYGIYLDVLGGKLTEANCEPSISQAVC